MEIDQNNLKYWLPKWGRWVAMGNKSPLGMKIQSYAERVGAGSGMRETDYSPDVETELLAIDDAWRSLPETTREVLRLHYCVPGAVSVKTKQSRERYYGKLELAQDELMLKINESAKYRQAFS